MGGWRGSWMGGWRGSWMGVRSKALEVCVCVCVGGGRGGAWWSHERAAGAASGAGNCIRVCKHCVVRQDVTQPRSHLSHGGAQLWQPRPAVADEGAQRGGQARVDGLAVPRRHLSEQQQQQWVGWVSGWVVGGWVGGRSGGCAHVRGGCCYPRLPFEHTPPPPPACQTRMIGGGRAPVCGATSHKARRQN